MKLKKKIDPGIHVRVLDEDQERIKEERVMKLQCYYARRLIP